MSGKKFSSKTTRASPLFLKVANDNRPPKRNFLGWICFIVGLLLSLGAGFWIYEKMTSYYTNATQWWTDEQALSKQRGKQTGTVPETDKPKDI